MKNQIPKKPTRTIQMNAKPSTPKEHSQHRMKRLQDALLKTINNLGTKVQKEGNGDITINEVIAVMTDMTYNYNFRSLEAQHREVQPKKKS